MFGINKEYFQIKIEILRTLTFTIIKFWFETSSLSNRFDILLPAFYYAALH